MSDPSAPAEVRVPISIRWRDLDMLGHLNQAVYHELLEEGRSAFFQRLGGMAFVIARVELDYRNEVRKDHGTVDVVIRPVRLGRSSVTVAQEILLPNGTVAAEGIAVLVAWDPHARRSRPFSEEERARIEALAAPT
jgi:acyl-CoA thioester hydrolase